MTVREYHIHTDADPTLSWSLLTYFLHSVHEYFSLDKYTDLNWKYTDHSVLPYTLLIQVFFSSFKSCAQSMMFFFFYKKTVNSIIPSFLKTQDGILQLLQWISSCLH